MNQYLIEADELYALSQEKGALLIDTRHDEEFLIDHLPNSVHVLDIFTYLCTRGNGSHPEMVKYFASKFRKVGVRITDTLVVYEDAMDNGYGKSCRGWFILSYLGARDVRVLHGGYRAWVNAGLPVSHEVPELKPTEFIPKLNNEIIVTAEEMIAAISNPEIQIVDCRDYAEWNGANSSPYGYDYCPRKGRIPGAKWLEWYRLMNIKDGIPWFKSSNEILELCREAGITPEKPVYLYCFKGARTSNTMIALKLAGFPVVRNYFNSWNEWSRDLSLPIEEGYPKQ